MAQKSYKGIYAIHINDKPYVGKDSNIFQSTRLTNHIAYLRNGTHYNSKMQEDFNTYGFEGLVYTILCFDRDYTEEQLRELEKEYVIKLDSFKNGYNSTEGGVGMWGYEYNSDQLEKKSIAMTGEKNPTSKLTNKEFYEIVDFLTKGYTNEEIADYYGLHSRYISLIRHKKRFKRLWEQIDYVPQVSRKGKENRRLSYDAYSEIMNLIDTGVTNQFIQDKYKLSSGTGSRIRHGKLYTDYYDMYKNNK